MISDVVVEVVELAEERVGGDFLVSRLVECGARGMDVRGAAGWLGVKPRTLSRQCREAGHPTPSVLLTLGRLLVCVARYNNGSPTCRHACDGLYSDHPTYNRALRRYTGYRPSELPSVEDVVDGWLERAAHA